VAAIPADHRHLDLILIPQPVFMNLKKLIGYTRGKVSPPRF
jgi:hypothetical protein